MYVPLAIQEVNSDVFLIFSFLNGIYTAVIIDNGEESIPIETNRGVSQGSVSYTHLDVYKRQVLNS